MYFFFDKTFSSNFAKMDAVGWINNRGGWRQNHGYPIKVISWWANARCNGRPA